MATISNNNIAQAIFLAAKDKTSAEQHLLSKNVVQFLSRKHLLSRSTDILAALEKIINHDKGALAVKVTSAEKLHEKTKVNIAHALKKRYSASSIIFDEEIDKNLLGGYRIEIDDEVIDLSIKNRIRKLQEHLIKE